MEPSATSCYVNRKLYPHLFLIPSVIIVYTLAFLNKRRSFKKDVCGGRPGLVIPLDFLGIDHNRLAVSAIFTVAAGLMLQVVIKTFEESSESNWIQALVTIGYALEVAMLFYPFFACLTTEHKLIGSIMGLFYASLWCALDMLYNFDKCKLFMSAFVGIKAANKLNNPPYIHGYLLQKDHSSFVSTILSIIPLVICYLFILGRFFTVIFLEARRRVSWTRVHEHDLDNAASKMDFTKPWLFKHVRNLLKPRPRVHENRCIHFLRLLYSPKANFHFSTQTVSIVLVCCISLYVVTVNNIILAHSYMEMKQESSSFANQCNTNFEKVFWGGCLAASTVLVAVVCVFSIVRFMECHKNNMLRMFKGDTSFIPKGLKRSQWMVGKCLKYAGYHIGFFVWGYVVLMFFFLILTGVLAVILKCEMAWNMLKSLFMVLLPYLCITLPLWGILIIASVTIFRDRSFKNDAITVDNRNVYLVVSYFYFFLGLPIGLFSAIFRVLKAIPIGFFMLPRVDQCVMLDGFQSFDNGYAAYICYLHVQAAHRNPVLRVFCQVVHDATRMTRDPADGTLKTTKQYRNKWFLLVTLIRNPQLKGYRKHMITSPVVRFVANETHVSVETSCVI